MQVCQGRWVTAYLFFYLDVSPFSFCYSVFIFQLQIRALSSTVCHRDDCSGQIKAPTYQAKDGSCYGTGWGISQKGICSLMSPAGMWVHHLQGNLPPTRQWLSIAILAGVLPTQGISWGHEGIARASRQTYKNPAGLEQSKEGVKRGIWLRERRGTTGLDSIGGTSEINGR